MLALLTNSISPHTNRINKPAFLTPKSKGIEGRVLQFGRAEVLHINLNMPLKISEREYYKYADHAFSLMADNRVSEAVYPRGLSEIASPYRIRRSDDLSLVRRMACEAVLDSIRGKGGVYVKVYSRMPSRDVSDCLFGVASECRYVTAAGGEWASGARKRLLREYGAATPKENSIGDFRVSVVFDGGYDYLGEDVVIDLTHGELKCPNMARPRLIEKSESQLPDCGFYDKSSLLAALVTHGGIKQSDLEISTSVYLDN